MILRRNISKGFTLIELMISLAIGLSLTATALTLYQQTAKNRNLIQAELALQETRYFLHQTLRQFINQSGYRPLGANADSTSILPVKVSSEVFEEVNNNWKKGRFFQTIENGFALRFEGVSGPDGNADGTIMNCLGEPIAENEVIELTFTVDSGLLACTSDNVVVNLIGTADDVLVEQMLVNLGIDKNNDGTVDSYLTTSDQVLDSDEVIAIKLSFLLTSANDVKNHIIDYTFNGTNYTPTDLKIRKESVTTVKLKH